MKKDETPQVEMRKLDPNQFLKQAADSSREADILAHAVPIEPSAPPPPPDEPPPPPVTSLPPAPRSIDPLDRILNKTAVQRLANKFGILGAGEQLVDAVLTAGGIEVKVTFRKPHYDDFLWALGEIENRIRLGQDLNVLRSDQSRTAVLNHLSSCCSVVKIEDQFVWDFFELTSEIKKQSPSWDSVSLAEVPPSARGELATNTHALLRHLHPDLLFSLRSEVLTAFPTGGGIEDEDEEPEDPSSAA